MKIEHLFYTSDSILSKETNKENSYRQYILGHSHKSFRNGRILDEEMLQSAHLPIVSKKKKKKKKSAECVKVWA